jgi:hypothetical protein
LPKSRWQRLIKYVELGAGGSACNPSYSRGKDQEDWCLQPARASSLWDPISKKPITKTGLVEWLKV